MPDGTLGMEGSGPQNVLLLSAEDDPAKTIRPRLLMAGADLDRIELVQGTLAQNLTTGRTISRDFRLPQDISLLEDCLDSIQGMLLIIDPLVAFLDPKVNSWCDQDVRTALAPLAEMARETWTAVVALRHLNKAAGMSAIHRGGGSIGIIGAARSGLLVAKSPDDPEHERILAATKSNLGPPMPSLRYRLVDGQDSHGISAPGSSGWANRAWTRRRCWPLRRTRASRRTRRCSRRWNGSLPH